MSWSRPGCRRALLVASRKVCVRQRVGWGGAVVVQEERVVRGRGGGRPCKGGHLLAGRSGRLGWF